MAGKSPVLSVRIIADAAKAAAGFSEAEKQVGGFESKLSKIGGVVDKAAATATVAGGAYVAFAKQTVDAASDLEQSVGAVNSVFGEQADKVMATAEQAAQGVGLATSEYANMASIMGSQLQNMGIPMDEVAGQTDQLISLGADLAAMYGGTTSEAVDALSSLLRGERDPIERYAVSINQAAIDAELAAQGLSGLEGEAAKQAETQATLKLLFDQSSNALGTFSRESETVAGQQQRANAEWQNAKAALGEQLLPIVTEGARLLGALAGEIGKHPELFKIAGAAIITFTGALQSISVGIKAVEAGKIAFGALNTVISANPIGAFITVLGLAAAGIVTAYQHSETFRDIVHRAGEIAADAFGAVADWVSNVWDWIKSVIDAVADLIGSLRDAWDWAMDVARAVGDALSFSGDGPEMTMQLAAGSLFKFLPQSPDITAALTPDITAARVDNIAKQLPSANTPTAPVYNVTINGVLDADDAAVKIREVLNRYERRQAW